MVVIKTYDRFLSYIVDNGLEEACDLKPIVNGSELIRSLGAKPGPWMSKALEMVVNWQLLHPELTEKEMALQEVSQRKSDLGLA